MRSVMALSLRRGTRCCIQVDSRETRPRALFGVVSDRPRAHELGSRRRRRVPMAAARFLCRRRTTKLVSHKASIRSSAARSFAVARAQARADSCTSSEFMNHSA